MDPTQTHRKGKEMGHNLSHGMVGNKAAPFRGTICLFFNYKKEMDPCEGMQFSCTILHSVTGRKVE
jgi:hypothetical protein